MRSPGLANRAAFTRELETAAAQVGRHGGGFALAFIDLDGFKAINDTCGHAAGDEVLVTVAARIRAASRASDQLCRLGGDEFVILLDGIAAEDQAMHAAARYAAAIEAADHLVRWRCGAGWRQYGFGALSRRWPRRRRTGAGGGCAHVCQQGGTQAPAAKRGVMNRTAQSLNTLCAALVTLGALMALTGWLLHIAVLTRLNDAFIPTQFNTALGFLCYGLGLGALNWRMRGIARALAGAALLIGLASLFEHLTGITLGIGIRCLAFISQAPVSIIPAAWRRGRLSR